jgi:hypothetical protein
MNEDLHNELNELASRISPRETPPPPPGYFDDLPDRILDRWNTAASQTRIRRITLIRWMSVAALTLGLVFGSWWWLHPENTGKPTSMTDADAYQYVMDHINDFSVMLDQDAQWPADQKLTAPDSASVQDYLMDELQGQDPEQLF